MLFKECEYYLINNGEAQEYISSDRTAVSERLLRLEYGGKLERRVQEQRPVRNDKSMNQSSS